MTAIGESLKKAREEKGLDLDRVSDETRIAKRFITALEEENFSVFPGDPYAIGFLKNYAEYLGLDAAELAASYNMQKMQEQPAPIQELLPTRKRGLGLMVAIAAVAVIAIIVTVFFLLGGRQSSQGASLSAPRNPTEYRVDSAPLDKRLWKDDSVVFSLGPNTWKIKVAGIGDGVILDTPFGQRRLSLGEESVLDFNGDGTPDLRILIADLDKRNADKGTEIRFTPLGPEAATAAPPSPDNLAADAATDQGQGSTSTGVTVNSTTASLKPENTSSTKEGAIFEGQKSSYPFVVSVTFRASCMFRYEVDRKDRDERYYQKGDTITVKANNAVKVWASNAQSAVVIVQASGGKSASIDLGGAGEIAVKRIAWVKNDNGSYTLSLFEVD